MKGLQKLLGDETETIVEKAARALHAHHVAQVPEEYRETWEQFCERAPRDAGFLREDAEIVMSAVLLQLPKEPVRLAATTELAAEVLYRGLDREPYIRADAQAVIYAVLSDLLVAAGTNH